MKSRMKKIIGTTVALPLLGTVCFWASLAPAPKGWSQIKQGEQIDSVFARLPELRPDLKELAGKCYEAFCQKKRPCLQFRMAAQYLS